MNILEAINYTKKQINNKKRIPCFSFGKPEDAFQPFKIKIDGDDIKFDYFLCAVSEQEHTLSFLYKYFNSVNVIKDIKKYEEVLIKTITNNKITAEEKFFNSGGIEIMFGNSPFIEAIKKSYNEKT